jgi:DamX protein
MIDDAHMLSDTTLQELIRYRQQLLNEKECALKILLFANKGMAATIKHISDLEQSEMFVQDLPSLNSKQILPFIQHRLVSAGASQQPTIDDKTVEAIHKRTTGNPLQIMAQAVAQIEKQAGKKSRAPVSISKPVLLGGGLLVAAAAAVYLFLFSAPDRDDLSLSVAPPVIPEPPARPAESPEPVTSTDLSHEEMPAPDTRAPTPEPMPAEPQPEIESTDLSDAPDSHILPGLAPTDPEQAGEAENEAETAAPVVSGEPPAPPQPPAPKPAAVPPPPPQVKPAPVPVVTRVTRPAPTSTTDPAFAELADLGLRDGQWLLQQDPNSWTLQILGAREPDTLVKFARQHQLGSDTAWYVTDLKGKPWYVLVHRSYSQRDVARQAINQLPAALKKARPWAKSMASVQKAIKK